MGAVISADGEEKEQEKKARAQASWNWMAMSWKVSCSSAVTAAEAWERKHFSVQRKHKKKKHLKKKELGRHKAAYPH